MAACTSSPAGDLDVVRRDLRDPTGTYISLSDGEFSLLRTFVEHPQRVLSRDQLLDYARGRESDAYRPRHRQPDQPPAAQDQRSWSAPS